MIIEVVSSANVQSAVFDVLLEKTQRHIDAVPPVVIPDLYTLSQKDAEQAALRQSWMLIADGLRYLKHGAPLSAPGSLAGAFMKTNLAASALARGIHVAEQPVREDMFRSGGGNSPLGMQPLFRSSQLMAAVIDDIPASRIRIAQKMEEVSPNAAFQFEAVAKNFSLLHIFRAISPRAVPAQAVHKALKAPTEVPQKKAENFLKQIVMIFNTLVPAYESACREFRQEIRHSIQSERPRLLLS